MLTSDFDFALPPDRIAQHPARPRDAARLLVVGNTLQDRHIRDLPTLLHPGDLLVVNDTRVIPAQLTARRGSARVGITLDQPQPDGTWHALARNARRLRPGDRLAFDGPLTADILGRDGDSVTLRFNDEAALKHTGTLALPPYIERPGGATADDEVDYQTLFAEREGAVAAPTAGLHFTPSLLASLDAAGIPRVAVTLHVGAGTFLPVRAERVEEHRIHAERGEVTPEAAERINAARRVVCVGTTTLRLLEAAADERGRVRPFAGDARTFIVPGVPVRTAHALLTNFHLPRSTLFMLVCAFAGTERMRDAYAHAISTGYRFYSYGDACLLERAA